MEFIPVHTRRLNPPEDDLYAALQESLTDVREKDVILITSKVVAIHQGRCILLAEAEKADLITAEADVLIDRPYHKYPLTIKYHTFLASAGIDESNSGDYYALLPNDPYESARNIREFLQAHFGVRELAVIITDSHITPLRSGTLGVSLGFWGMRPVEFHQGKKDLFGREIIYSSTNIVDSLAAGAGLVSGESHEQVPVVIARSVPYAVFTNEDCRHELLVDPEEDLYRVLFKSFLD